MKQKTYFITTLVIFLVLACFHLLRVLGAWPAEIGGVTIPLGISWIGVGIAGYLAFSAYRLWSDSK